MNLDGIKYRCINTIYYYFRNITKTWGALVDRGTNGELLENNVRIISKISCVVNVQGIDNQRCIHTPFITAGAITCSQCGYAIIIINQYVYIGGGKTIQSSGYTKAFQYDFNDRSISISDENLESPHLMIMMFQNYI